MSRHRALFGRNVHSGLGIALMLLAHLGCSGTSISTSDRTESENSGKGEPADIEADYLLSQEIRQFLWDTEHLCFVVEQKVLPTWKRAIAGGDRETLAEFLSDDFRASVPADVWQEDFGSGPMESYRWRASDDQENVRPADAEDFLDHLMEYRGLFDREPEACKVGIGLVRFGPADVKTMSGPWKAVWRIQLSGRRGEQSVDLLTHVAMDLDMIDEHIGDRRHWVRTVAVQDVQRVESTASLMRETTADSGLDTKRLWENWEPEREFQPNTGGVYLSDYNRDGRLDVLIDDIAAGVTLYQGLGDGRFSEVTEQAGLPRLREGQRALWTLSCWADFDGDGDEDLIAQDRLYENAGDGTFRDITDKSNLLLTPAAGYALADYDRDGRIDLYVCHTNAYRFGQRQREKVEWIDGGLGIDNVLWRNLGDWQFEDVTARTKTGGNGSSCFAAVWFDANQDNWPDLLAINEFGRNSLLLNSPQGEFRESDLDPVFGGFSMGVTAGHFDDDGLMDIYVANMYSKAGNRILANVDTSDYPKDLFRKIVEATTGNKLYRSQGDGSFEVIPPEDTVAYVGWAYGSNFFDLNGDGLLDMYTTAGFKSEERGKPDG